MSSVSVVIFSVVFLAAAYKLYGGFVERKVFGADDRAAVPSIELKDDVDFFPTNKEVLFGHHFASIAGTGPIVGPAIAVIWGWLPALAWILIGSVFAGAVHDYAALIMSVRKRGVSVGELSREIINPRVRILFLFVIFFSLWIVVAIFGMVIAVIFKMYPQAVFPVWVQIPIAMTAGWLSYKKRWNITYLSFIAVAAMYAAIFVGVNWPFVMPSVWGLEPMSVWIILLFVYAYAAAVLPVWSLLQPRDYVNSHQLIVGIVLIVLGIFFARPEIVAPILQLKPRGAPPVLPFLFITVACGAISGFHSLVSSGTTSKQIRSEKDVRFISFGGMLTEGLLGVLVIIAVTAGIGMYVKTDSGTILTGSLAWQHHYASWTVAKGLTAKVTAFVNGSSNMLGSLGIPLRYGQALVGVLIASFAGTTLDTATRIQRYIISELGSTCKVKFLKKRHPATAVAVIAAAALAFAQGQGKGALILWPLFGTSNQLLAGLVLLVATVYLIRRGVNYIYTFLPMLFMIITSSWALSVNLCRFYLGGQYHLFIIGCILLLLEVWMVVEAVLTLKKTTVRP